VNRREFLFTAPAALCGRDGGKTRVGLVQSTHPKLARKASLDDPLDYALVRDMVWKAIEYGAPRAGSLAAKVRPGSWVVVKPNMVFMRPQPGYRTGDITDLRVTRSVIEYLARYSQAGRITLAEGGSYRNLRDASNDSYVMQNGHRVTLADFDWGPAEFPDAGGSVGGILREFAAEFSGKRFDYIDLSYDAARDGAGRFRRIPVPVSSTGVGAFGARPDYFVTNTILGCDFLITVPVVKTHLQCGLTACFKNYVGTAPREANSHPGAFHNLRVHDEHSVDNRIDPFIVDLAAFHPPDFCVADGIRGLQYQEHDIALPDQMMRNNFVVAGEDPVAVDATIARLMGFNAADMEFLHLAAKRGMGTMDPRLIELSGDDPERVKRRWGKPAGWYGRCNRDWLLGVDRDGPPASWSSFTSPTDTLDFAKALGGVVPGRSYGAAARIHSLGHQSGFLWLGFRGRLHAELNGEQVFSLENRTRHRVGQFRQAIALEPGKNLLRFRLEALDANACLSCLLVDAANGGDSLEDIRFSA
jgi:uncharacterized protein (DUF362 family)